LPVVTSDEALGKTFLEQNGHKFEVELVNGEVRVLREIPQSDAA
jgi:hypothetical protein